MRQKVGGTEGRQAGGPGIGQWGPARQWWGRGVGGRGWGAAVEERVEGGEGEQDGDAGQGGKEMEQDERVQIARADPKVAGPRLPACRGIVAGE